MSARSTFTSICTCPMTHFYEGLWLNYVDRDNRDDNDDERDDNDGDNNDDKGYLKVHTMYYYLVDLINLFSCI